MNENKVIKELNKKTFTQLKQKEVIKDGMIPKLDNAFTAIENGVKSVTIGSALELTKLMNHNAGTTITK